jgi:hypothetical protein
MLALSEAEEAMYEAPSITELGTVADLTAANGLQNHIDADFPEGTPFGDLTFS